ncbi:MAG: hypothetical protein ACR2GN_00380 [Bacteroidia bacterium]
MKYAYTILAAALIALSSCSSTYQARNAGSDDDVYYSPGADPVTSTIITGQKTQPASQQSPSDYTSDTQNTGERFQYSDEEQSTDGNGNTYITNNYYTDDYYDYSYSSRIRRFHRPAGFGYYSTYYTNSYWYDYYPPSYGVSIYVGYNCWPSPTCIRYPFYYGYHCPRPYYYGYYYNPGYYWHSYNYGYGYNQGYWDGYHAGLYNGYYSQPYYFNSYDQTSYYYGPRGTAGSNNATVPPTLATTYSNSVEKGEVPVNPVGHYDLSAEQVKNNTIKQDPKSNFYTSPVKAETTTGTVKPATKTDVTKTDQYTPAVKPAPQQPVKQQPDTKPVVPQQAPVKQQTTDPRPGNIKSDPSPSEYSSPDPVTPTKPQPQTQPSRGEQTQPQPAQPSRGTQQSTPQQTQPSERGTGTQPQSRPSNRYQQGPSPQQYSAPMDEDYNSTPRNFYTPAQPQVKPQQPQQRYQPQPQPRQQKTTPAPQNNKGSRIEKPSQPSQPAISTPSNRSGSTSGSNNNRSSRGR